MITVPVKPKDGERVTFWKITNSLGLRQYRATYYVSSTYKKVTGDDRHGAPFISEWYMESRYVPRESLGWTGTGRNTTEHLRAVVTNRRDFGEVFATFDEARAALRRDLLDANKRARDTIDETDAIWNLLSTMTEPPP